MKTCLLDANALLALVWPHHVHHGVMHQWWQTSGIKRWATCTQTQLAFVRISCHPKFAPIPASPKQAIQMLQQMISRRDHEFWTEAPGCVTNTDLARRLSRSLAHGQITDSYLASLTHHHDGCLVTFDVNLAKCHPDVAQLIS